MRPLTDLEIGDVISCPNCDSPQLRCLSLPASGEIGYARHFENINIASDRRLSCTECPIPDGVWLKDDGRWHLHVRGKGWLRGAKNQ